MYNTCRQPVVDVIKATVGCAQNSVTKDMISLDATAQCACIVTIFPKDNTVALSYENCSRIVQSSSLRINFSSYSFSGVELLCTYNRKVVIRKYHLEFCLKVRRHNDSRLGCGFAFALTRGYQSTSIARSILFSCSVSVSVVTASLDNLKSENLRCKLR